jgi:hypothetical protein
MKSYDVKLAGDPYVFDGEGIELGGAPREAVAPGQLGTLIIPSVHLGLGHARDTTAGRYWYATGAITHKPGFLLPDFARTAALATYPRLSPLYPWNLVYEKGGPLDIAFLIGPKKIYWFDPNVDSPTPLEVTGADLSTTAGNKRYTGSCFLWNNQWIFGVEDATKKTCGFTTITGALTSILPDAHTSGKTGAAASLTWSHTIGGGSDRFLIVGVSNQDSTGSIDASSVTYGGVALTKIGTVRNATGQVRVSLWYLKEATMPAAGAHDVVVTMSASTSIIAGASTWAGVHQTTPLGTLVTNTAFAYSIITTVAAAAGDLIHDVAGTGIIGGAPLLFGPSDEQTTEWNSKDTYGAGGGSVRDGATSVDMGWLGLISPNVKVYFATVAVPIKPTSFPVLSATLTLDTAKAVSFGAAQRGRLFWTQNQGNGNTLVYWAPAVAPAVNFEGVGFTKYGPIYTDNIRSTWVTLWGGTLFIAREDGSVLGTDETGFLGLAMPAPVRRSSSPDSPMLAGSFGRNAAPYLDMLLLPAIDTVWGFSPHTLAIRTLDPSSVQATDDAFTQSMFLATASAGTHAFVGGLTTAATGGVGRIYRLVYESGAIVAHAFGADFAANVRVVSLLTCMRFDSDRDPTLYLYSLTDDGTNVKLYRNTIRTDVNPTSVHPTPTVSDPVYLALPVHSGDDSQQNISKLFLQVRGRVALPAGGTPKLAFVASVDGNSVTIADVTTDGEFAQPITSTTPATRIGRSFFLGLNLHGTNVGKTLFFPVSVDFLWVPSQHDLITLTVLAAGDTVTRHGGTWTRTSAKDAVDKLMALRNTITTAEFPEGTAGASAVTGTVTWSLFVQNVIVEKKTGEVSGAGANQYAVILTCRKL